MSIGQARAVEWNGSILTGWIAIDGKQVRVSADRETIYRHAPGWDDALTWEIERHCEEIFDKLTPFFKAQSK
jgi:hypothetical protein